jgi:hypothetical protein
LCSLLDVDQNPVAQSKDYVELIEGFLMLPVRAVERQAAI